MLNELSLTAAVARIAAGDITSERLVRDCLDRIEARDRDLKAWAHIDPELALEQAQARDAATEPLGPLHGVPVGVKDIIMTSDMPTGMGSPIYDGYRPPYDAACVALIRQAGGVILGKTATVEFAGMAPPPNCNPHDMTRTPGGSSSGSGSAVADFQVPVAFGTQTAGSIHRPASYCGVIGWKPTFGTFSTHGVWPAAQSLDTLGMLARSVEDCELVSAVLLGSAPLPDRPRPVPKRIAMCRTHLWDSVLPESDAALEDVAGRLSEAGTDIVPLELPDPFAALTEARDVISSFERARATAFEYHNHRDLLSTPLRRTVEKGFSWDHGRYLDARRQAGDCRAVLDGLFDGFDAIISPCVAGEAPVGLESTGDHAFIGFWNLLHVPSFSLPTHKGPNNMPVGIQLIGRHGHDSALHDVARSVMNLYQGVR